MSRQSRQADARHRIEQQEPLIVAARLFGIPYDWFTIKDMRYWRIRGQIGWLYFREEQGGLVRVDSVS